MSNVRIYNMDCREAIKRIDDHSIDLVLTSPPYATTPHISPERGRVLKDSNAKGYPWLRYDVYMDNLTNEQFVEWQVKLFNDIDRILKPNGSILYNISYSANNTTGWIDTVHGIVHNTPFTMADKIVWKKKAALPNNHSHVQLTRICEDVFVFCRKCETKTFHTNKKIVSYRETGQANYENIFAFIEAENNDGSQDLNKATFSTSFAEQLLRIYARLPKTGGGVVFDPFIGTGTTACACRGLGIDCIGSEISQAQCDYAYKRLGGGVDLFTTVEIVRSVPNQNIEER